MQLLKEKVKSIADILLGYEIQQVQDSDLNVLMYQNVKPFSGRDLAYLLAPHTSSFQIRTTKFYHNYVDSLVIDTLLDFIHNNLRDFEIRVLIDTFPINKLQLALPPH